MQSEEDEPAELKPARFLGNSLKELKSFPKSIISDIGFQLDLVQRGLPPADSKPLKTVAPGVSEIREKDRSGTYRLVYIATLPDAVYILCAFKKTTQQTPTAMLDLARERMKEIPR